MHQSKICKMTRNRANKYGYKLKKIFSSTIPSQDEIIVFISQKYWNFIWTTNVQSTEKKIYYIFILSNISYFLKGIHLAIRMVFNAWNAFYYKKTDFDTLFYARNISFYLWLSRWYITIFYQKGISERTKKKPQRYISKPILLNILC